MIDMWAHKYQEWTNIYRPHLGRYYKNNISMEGIGQVSNRSEKEQNYSRYPALKYCKRRYIWNSKTRK